MSTRILPALGLLALVAATACGTSEPTPDTTGESGSRVSASPSRTTQRATGTVASSRTRPSTNAFTEGKPCDLLTRDEQTDLGLEPPGKREQNILGNGCVWPGRDFSMIVTIAGPLAQIESSRPGQRTTVAGRPAIMVRDTQFAGLCELAVQVTAASSADVLVSRYDKNAEVACLDAAKAAGLLHPRLPGA